MPERAKRPPGEALVDLRRRLSLLPLRDPARADVVARAAQAYGISASTVYRSLRELTRPKPVRRADHGTTKAAPQAEMERYAEIVAALKVRTSNKKGHRLSTRRPIELLEEDRVETPDGLVRAPKGLLKRPTLDRFMRASGYDHARITGPSAAVRFQARRANELWHFDMSPSDLKHVKAPLWIEEGRGKPTLMLFSVVDGRSGVAYQEYRCVYGETVWCGWPTQPQTHSVSAGSACPGRRCPEATGRFRPSPGAAGMAVRSTPFPEAPAEVAFPSRLAARFAIADLLGHPLGRLGPEDLGFIDALLSETLVRDHVVTRVRERFQGGRGS